MEEDREGSQRNEEGQSPFQSFSSGQNNYSQQPLTFVPAPDGLPALYGLYSANRQKIRFLQKELKQSQKYYQEAERLKDEGSLKPNEVETLDDENELSTFIKQYETQMVKRTQQLQALSESYRKLNALFLQESILATPKMYEMLQKFVQARRKTLHISSTSYYLLVLAREQHIRDRNLLQSPKILNRSSSDKSEEIREQKRSGSKDGKQRVRSRDTLDEKKELYSSILVKLIALPKIIHRLVLKTSSQLEKNQLSQFQKRHKQASIQLEEDKSFRLLSPSNSNYIRATYDEEGDSFFILDDMGVIIQVDSKGAVVNRIQIDQECILLFEALGGTLIVGSRDGIVRIYSYQNEIGISHIYGCFAGQDTFVGSYWVSRQQGKIKGILFTIQRRIYYLKLDTWERIQLGEVPEKIEGIWGNFLFTSSQCYCDFYLKGKFQLVPEPQLTKLYLDRDRSQQIIGVVPADGRWGLLSADSIGSLDILL